MGAAKTAARMARSANASTAATDETSGPSGGGVWTVSTRSVKRGPMDWFAMSAYVRGAFTQTRSPLNAAFSMIPGNVTVTNSLGVRFARTIKRGVVFATSRRGPMPISIRTLYAVKFRRFVAFTGLCGIVFATVTLNLICAPGSVEVTFVVSVRPSMARTIHTPTWAVRGDNEPLPRSVAVAVARRDLPSGAFAATSAGADHRYDRPPRRKRHCHVANVPFELRIGQAAGCTLALISRTKSGSRVRFTRASWS